MVSEHPDDPRFIQKIQVGYDRFSDTYKKVADFILGNMVTATFASLDELSGRVGVSDATLIRFARELGYDGFQDLRRDMVEHIRDILYPSREFTPAEDRKENTTLELVRDADIGFINRTINGINREQFEQLIELIVNARRIFCMGWGLSSFLAEFLAFQLQRLTFEAQALIRERRPLVERVLFLKRGDLLIIFDLIEYSTEVSEAVDYLRDNNDKVRIVTITNDPTARIVRHADLSFFCDTLSTLISLTAPMCLINAIAQHVIAKRPRKSRQAVAKFHREVVSDSGHYFRYDQNNHKKPAE